MTIAQWLSQAEQRLQASGSPDPRPDAEWILEWTTGKSRMQLILSSANALSPQQHMRAEEALARRETGMPLQYVLSEAWFYGRRFLSDARALIPRMDTEILVETALAHMPKGAKSILELCTGTGIIAITMALACPACTVTATDLSQDALTLAAENAALHNAKLRLLQGDLFAPVQDQVFDVLLANPPYLTPQELTASPQELAYEPGMALLGGEDGLVFYRRITAEASAHLNPGGLLALEIGATQAEAVCRLLSTHMPGSQTHVERDLQGLPRVVWTQKPMES